MDILSHTFSGLAIGATTIHFSKKGPIYNCLTVLTCGLAAFFPDLDVITQWSGFDSIIGGWFKLDQAGKVIYHQKRWFSHHAFFHSVWMALIFTSVVFLILKIYERRFSAIEVLRRNKLMLISSLLSYLIHVFEDMPTPSFVWGGVAFLFPSEDYWGGKGYIWWWNNYDLFLIIISVFILNVFIKCFTLIFRMKTRLVSCLILAVGFTLYMHQMLNRNHDFNYTGMKSHYEVWRINEDKSKRIQKDILGEKFFRVMEKVDNIIPFWF